MYEEFKDEKLMGESDYAPFNEAMCANATTKQIFDEDFINTRASGHHGTSRKLYQKGYSSIRKSF